MCTDGFASDITDNLLLKAIQKARGFNEAGLFDTIHSWIRGERSFLILNVYDLYKLLSGMLIAGLLFMLVVVHMFVM